MANSVEILRVEGLSKRFGKFQAVDDLSFTLGHGEILGFLGRNGAGKSTTIRMLCNLVRADAGEAILNGVSILNGRTVAHRTMIGAVIEAPRFYPQLSGYTNLAQLARLRGESPARIGEILERVGLNQNSGVLFGHYSMGMRQRLGLAAAFLHRPRLAILDEPTTGLDPVGQRQIRTLIRQLASEEGGSILLCSHLLDEVAELCGRAVVMENGRKILDHSLDEPGGIAAVQACFDSLSDGTEMEAIPR